MTMNQLDHYLQIIFRILSIIYLNSYSLQSNRTIFDFYTCFLLIKEIGWKRFKSLPILERLQFLNATILGIYHLTKSFGWIEYSKTIKFLIGDMTPIMSNDVKSAENLFSFFLSFCFLFSVLIIYNTFCTENSLSFRTLIMYLREYDNNNNYNLSKIHQIIQIKYGNYSRTSSLLFNYSIKKFPTNIKKLRLYVNRFYYFIQIFIGKFYNNSKKKQTNKQTTI